MSDADYLYMHINAFNLLSTSLMLTKMNWNYIYEMTALLYHRFNGLCQVLGLLLY